ncbi:MAG: hypothetical protein FWC15_06995 [Fibromonadales bacterium]|nr:hypothetical protein [Fibromonadales bacterium]
MNTNKFLLVAILAMLVPAVSHSQYIINDKDGWTNMRKGPNAKASVVGKVYKHQVFLPQRGCDDEMDGEPVIYDDNWLAVDVGSDAKKRLKGYIFKNNIIDIMEFPAIENEVSYNEKNDVSTTTAKKGNITVTMETRPNENRRFGRENRLTAIINGKRTAIKPYIDLEDFSLFVGYDGALYLGLYSKDIIDERMVAWYSIVNGNITFQGSWYTGVC